MANCTDRWILYLAWAKAAPDVQEIHRTEYVEHLQTCDKCVASMHQLAEHSRNAVMPDLTAEEIERA